MLVGSVVLIGGTKDRGVSCHWEYNMNRTEFRYIPTIELSYPARRYSSGDASKDKPSSIAAIWLALVPFQMFASIEPHPSFECKAVVEQFCNVVERFHRCPLSGIIGYETAPTTHAHMCFACPVRLDLGWIRDYLKQQKLQSFDLQQFDPALDGLPYTLKSLNWRGVIDSRSGGEVDYRNLDYYLKTPVDRKDRKRQARHQRRMEKLYNK